MKIPGDPGRPVQPVGLPADVKKYKITNFNYFLRLSARLNLNFQSASLSKILHTLEMMSMMGNLIRSLILKVAGHRAGQ